MNDQYILNNLDQCKYLPHPDYEWQYKDIELNKSAHNKLSNESLIEVVDRERKVKTWRTKQKTWDVLVKYADGYDIELVNEYYEE